MEISGANFDPARAAGEAAGKDMSVLEAATDTVWCKFGSAVTIGSRVSDALLRCLSPPRGSRAVADVEVSVSINSGVDFTGGTAGLALVR